MKKTIKTVAAALLLTCTAAGCFDLDKMPLDTISDKAVFSDQELTMAYLNNIYGYMPCGYGISYVTGNNRVQGGLGITDLLDGSTDLLRSVSPWNESNGVLIPGTISPNYNPLDVWALRYEVIRKINNLLANTEAGSELPEDFRLRVRAEARFVRAFMYFDLVRRYGDVPLIRELQNYDNLQELLVPRDPADKVYDFIYSELTEIASEGGLPAARDMGTAELGRASREAAWALNGRAMLFAQRWEESARESAKVLESGYHRLADDYNALFQSHGGDPEVIFEVLYDGINKAHAADLLYMPPSLDNGWGAQSCPTQELVDSYEMLDGTPFDWSNPAHAAAPYEGRDKRLQWSIIVDGSVFKNKVIRTAYMVDDDGLGLIGKTNTGYYIRKFLDETVPFEKLLEYKSSSTSWKELRLAEVLLNYAEALNEANEGPDAEAYDAVNRVRARAGLPELPAGLDYQGFRERVIQERKVELAFEGHRFWDLRRWRMAVEVLNNKYFHGIRITEDGEGHKTYDVFEVSDQGVPRQVFLEKHYLMPINQGEVEKNPNLLPNNGY